MADIIVFPLKERKEEKRGHLLDSKSNYLHRMRSKLSKEDYLEFLESCLHPGIYHVAEEDIKNLVDGYFKS